MKPTSRSLILLPTCGHRLPSAAAEIVRPQPAGSCRASCSPDSSGWKWRWTISASRQRRFTQLFHRLQQQHPQLRLARQQTAPGTPAPADAYRRGVTAKRAEQRQKRTVQRLNHYNPQPRIHRAQSRIQQLEYRLAEIMRGRLSERRERFGNAVTHLEAVSPLATLARATASPR